MEVDIYIEGRGEGVGLLAHVVEVSLGYVHITGQGLEVVVCLLGAEVARAQDVLNLAWHLGEGGREGGGRESEHLIAMMECTWGMLAVSSVELKTLALLLSISMQNLHLLTGC